MSWGKQKSRVSLRNLLRNKKTAVIAAVCCVVAVGAYIGFHRLTSEAANENVVRGVLSYVNDQYGVKDFGKNSTTESMKNIDMEKKTGDRKTMGTVENPFMILELVPWQGSAEFPYYIEGCETADYYSPAGCYDSERAEYYHSIGKEEEKIYDSYPAYTYTLNNLGSKVAFCFEEEDYPGKGLSEGDWNYKYSWVFKNEEKTIKGYYEKVAGTAVEGNFVIDREKPVDAQGRPVFKKVDPGKGDFVWVSLDNQGSEIPQYDIHQKKENKPAFSTDASWNTVNGNYAAGDREYTSRTDTGYWTMEGSQVPKFKFVHYNDFLRYSLQLRTIEEVEKYSVVVKPVEPAQLKEHPEYIDYADLIWVHSATESQIGTSYYNDAKDYEIFLKDKKTNGVNNDPNFLKSPESDIGWIAGEKLYFKANGLTKYNYDENGKMIGDPVIDYSGDGRFSYAPVILSSDVIGKIKATVQTRNNTAYHLYYDDMTLDKSWPQGNSGSENGFYQFFLMDTLMDQDVFYDLFYTPLATTHQPVIQTIDNKGYNMAQEGDAQTLWCPEAFLPAVHALTGEFSWGSPAAKELMEKYKIFNPSLVVPNRSILGYTYIYNSNNGFYHSPNEDDFGKDEEFTSGAHEWFAEHGQEKDNLSQWDIVNFLLHYEKGGSNINGSRTKKSIRSLEIEPGNDFYLNETSLKALFPASKYKMTIEPPVHMTTAEFNGSKIDLSEYDLVYVGTCRGKMNTKLTNMDHGNLGWYEEEDAQYNDANLTSKLYLHVGDSVKAGNTNYRLAGTDITKEQVKKLKDYAKSGNVLVFADVLYQGSSSSLYKKNVDISSNMNSLIKDVTSRENVVSLTNIRTSNNIVSTEVKGSAVAITTPRPYVNIVDSDKKDDTVKATLSGNKLTFSFSIGYPGDENVKNNKHMKYGVRLYVDTNGDGIITEAEDGSEICTWDSDAETGAVYPAGTIDASGKEQPAKYTINYTIDKERKNGAIAWKFEVFSIDNENVKTVASGVSRYNGYEENDHKVKNRINVLQIIPTAEYNKTSTRANLEKELTKVKSSSQFARYAKDLDDYEITVKTIPLKKSATNIEEMGYLDAFKYVNSNEYDTSSNSRENFSSGGDYYYPSKYMEYGVYLFSCGEEFEKADNSDGAVSFASWLSENGRSVIYTANSIYDSDNAAVNGVAKLLKDSAGLSRYSSSSDSTKKYNDKATYDKNGKAEEYDSTDYNAYQNLEYTYCKLTESGQSGNKYLPFSNDIWKRKDGNAVGYGSNTDSTDTLSQINKGTVCVYPYTITDPRMDILDRFEDKTQVPISGYASQDYQVNLNNPMADVWYCLSGKEDTTYGISPNDAWNNYYLYNVDNVFYDGISLENGGTTDLEMQLFVNILIGAYEASYQYPYITADKLEILPAGNGDAGSAATPSPEELKIKLLDTSDEERNYEFSVSGVNSQFVEEYRYKEYKASAAPIVNVSAAPTQAPTPTSAPTQDPSVTPEPTATPAATPITLMENTLGATGIKWESKYADWMKGLSNDAVIQIAYRCKNRVDGSDYVLETYGGYDDWKQGRNYTACVEGSTDSTEIQVVRMTIGEFKQSFERQVALTDDLQYVCLRPYKYDDYNSPAKNNIVLLSVRLYAAGMDFGDINDPSIDTGGVAGGGEDDDEREEEVIGTDFLPDATTHKIYFTPYDGNLVGGNIRSVKLEFVSDKNDDANTLSEPISTVFREKKVGAGLKTYRIIDGSGAGMFTEAANRHLIDSKQYYIPFNKQYVNIYGYIKMSIWNKKRSSVTYIQINDQVTQQTNTKDVYMFNLD